MFKKLFMVALVMILIVSAFTSIVKADVYEYENIHELEDYVANVINKKDTYDFKYIFNRSDYHVDFIVTVNWNKKTVTFSGFVRRLENENRKEKFNAVLNLRSNTIKTTSKLYKKGNNTLSAILLVWSYRPEKLSAGTLGHYLVDLVSVINRDTTYIKTGDKVLLDKVEEVEGSTFYSKAEVSKSKLLRLEVIQDINVLKLS